MKKLLVILMSIIILTGCSKKEDTKESISFDRVIAYQEVTVNIPTEPLTTTTTTTSTTTTSPTTSRTTTTTVTPQVVSVNLSKEQEVYNDLIRLKSVYPTGYKWDNSKLYEWNGGANYKGGYECAGFVFMLSDTLFEDKPAERRYDLENVKVGDIIRYKNDNHSVMVLTKSKDYITVVEANIEMEGYDYPIVLWGRKIPLEEIEESFTNYVTRY